MWIWTNYFHFIGNNFNQVFFELCLWPYDVVLFFIALLESYFIINKFDSEGKMRTSEGKRNFDDNVILHERNLQQFMKV